MQTIKLYKYKRAEGGITVSPNKPNTEYTEMLRLVADEGKVLTKDSEEFVPCVDVDCEDGWYEVDDTELNTATATDYESNTATATDYEEALESLGVNFNV